ncbi:MAG: VWA domain-containing protein [Sphingobacteriaceae bacterium]|nr:VWA domain-containing protein [Sphingobacteriaceae bacterium]
MKRTRKYFVLLFILTSSFVTLRSQVTNRILFIFDDSYSMYAPWSSSNSKIDVAKKVMAEFLDSLKNIPDLEIALRCYGHQTYFRPTRDCKDTKLEVPFAPVKTNYLKVKQRILKLDPTGTTPIAYSLGECAADFTPKENVRNLVILITDGIEECGGNPCEVSLQLQKKGIFLKPFVIGVGLNVNFADVFACMGKFYDVSNELNFKDVLKLVTTEALTQTTVQVDLLDITKKPSESDVDMTFYIAGTNTVKYNYLHTINVKGNPDTLVLDPDLQYDLVVHTIPPIEKKNISITRGKHNTIPLNAPQGFLKLELDGPIGKNFPATVVRKAGDMTTLIVQDFGKTEKLIVGKYDLEILTLPRIKMNDVEIKQSITNSIKIPTSGLAYIKKLSEGFGSIYTDDGKNVEWVYNLNQKLTNEIIYLQPGKYKVVFRYQNAKETVQTFERNFEIKSGLTQNVQLY